MSEPPHPGEPGHPPSDTQPTPAPADSGPATEPTAAEPTAAEPSAGEVGATPPAPPTPAPAAVTPGPRLGGRYRLDSLIARGGMGEVWRATDEVLNRAVAAKVLRPEYADEEIFLERFRSEARNTAALVHTGIAQVYDFGQASLAGVIVPYIVMELVPGEPLSKLLERGGALEVDRALELVAQAARGLQAAHAAGVIHRDVKPANLLVTPAWTVKITDFGIARAGDSLPLTRSGTVMGTAHYLAPELISTKRGAAPASDVYALGVVLYECLAGHRPFTGENPLAVAMAHLHNEPPPIPGLPEPVARLVADVLSKDPTQRPGSAAELAHRLLSLRIDLAAGVDAEAVATTLAVDEDPTAIRDAADRWTHHAAPRAGSAMRRRAARAATPAGGGHHRSSRGRRRRTRPPVHRRPGVLAGAALTVALGLGVLWLDDSEPTVTVVPSVAGVAEYDAGQALRASGLKMKVLREVNETVPAGVVLSQRPAAGSQIPADSDVELLVSSGPPAVQVDPQDWVGKPFAEVQAELEQRGLQVQEQQVTGEGATGTVTDVSPQGPVPVGDTVVVSVVVGSPESLDAQAAREGEESVRAGEGTGRNRQ